jgi:HD-GYP domain-containing protein (c-di-GMP phosphodiesterase class II)
MAEQVVRGSMSKLAYAPGLVDPFVDMIRTDPALPLLMLKLRGDDDEYLFQHGMNVAMLSITVAHTMGFNRDQVFDVGLGAMFQDIGMLRVPEQIRLAKRAITPDERLVIERHPISAADILERAGSLGQTALMVAYQAHERVDHSGYPRRRGGQFIHPLARIVNVADTYAALTCTRPHRPAITPYEAIVKILQAARDGHFDRRVVRGFVDCLSLFPVGSYVQLSDGTVARVMRSSGAQHTRPTVVPLNADGTETDIELDMKMLSGLEVVKALDWPEPPSDGEGVRNVA